MNVAPGTRLGPYELLARIGAGGMGEVWKARDTRLERSVAVKILPAEFAQNAQLQLRFEREAKTISQLDHPHICKLFDVGDGYLVMEYLEGEVLADRLARGALPLAEVIRLGMQTAEALECAHRSGVVHRDLKPGNIMLTKSGTKLLDFGLARSAPSTVTPIDATQHKPLTQEGAIIGTYPYMSPEQIAGEQSDARSDIFALGAVLYEMLTGRRAFDGKTNTSIIAAIVGGEPRAIQELQPLTPAALDHVITKCLAKAPDARWQSAADIATELGWISRSPPAAASIRPVLRLTTAALLVASVIAAAAIVVAMSFQRRLDVAERPIRAELTFPPTERLVSVFWGSIALSPDATRVAMLIGPFLPVGTPGLQNSDWIAVRDFASGQIRKLAGTEGAEFPFWSADGKQIGFFANQKLKTVTADGGAVQVLCDARHGRGGAWSPAGVIVFAPEMAGPIFKINEGGGTPVPVTKTAKGWTTNRNPSFLPDGRTFLYVGRGSESMSSGAVYAGSVDGTFQQEIVKNGSNAVFASGWLFFVRNNNLLAQRFDPKTLTVSGTPVAMADNLDYYNPRDLGNFSAAREKIVYVPALNNSVQIALFDRTGRMTDTKGAAGDYRILDVSPDGTRVALSAGNGSSADVWVMQLDRGVLSRSTFANAPIVSAVFSPDGSWLATATNFGGRHTKVAIRALHGNVDEQLVDYPGGLELSAWSPDRKYLVGAASNEETAGDFVYIDIERRTVVTILKSPAEVVPPALSQNGKWLAYTSAESGSPQVYVTAFPSGQGKWQVSGDGGAAPRWSRDGKHLLFVSGGKLFVTDVRDGTAPQFGAPAALPLQLQTDPLAVGYGEMPDGKIVVLKRAGEASPTAIHLITNWSKLLPR